VGTRCANHVIPLYPQKLAPTSPTGGGRSVGMVRSRTKATEFSLVFLELWFVEIVLKYLNLSFPIMQTNQTMLFKELNYAYCQNHS